jgi:hypothetical protein
MMKALNLALFAATESYICLVTYDLVKNGGAGSKFHNLIRCDTLGNALWVAELPDVAGVDAYVSFDLKSYMPLLSASTWSGYLVEIDLDTGQITKQTFTK